MYEAVANSVFSWGVLFGSCHCRYPWYFVLADRFRVFRGINGNTSSQRLMGNTESGDGSYYIQISSNDGAGIDGPDWSLRFCRPGVSKPSRVGVRGALCPAFLDIGIRYLELVALGQSDRRGWLRHSMIGIREFRRND